MAAHVSPRPSSALIAPLQVDTIEAGVPLNLIAEFSAASGIPLKQICAIVIPLRTLKHRRSRAQNLSPDESDKLARLIRVFNHTVQVFGNPEKATRWLSKPRDRFQDRTPLDMLRTDAGGRLVEEMLWQIAEGMFV